MLAIETTQAVLDSLNAEDFQAALPEGKIHWLDASRNVVAHANIKFILSYAPRAKSMMWGSDIAQYKAAGVPMLARPPREPGHREDVSLEDAVRAAAQAATSSGAQYLYRASAGPNSLFLAVFDFSIGAAALPSLEKRVAGARNFVLQKLTELVIYCAVPRPSESLLFMDAAAAFRQQSEHVVREHAIGADVRSVASRMDVWAQQLDKCRAVVLDDMNQAIARFESTWRASSS